MKVTDRPTHPTLAPLSRDQTLSLLDRYDSHHAELIRRFHREMEDLSSLDPSLSALCLVGGAIALRAPGQAREFMLRARDAGASPAQVLEVVMLCMNFAGFASMAEGLQVFDHVLGAEAGPGERPEDYPVGPEVEGFDGPSLAAGVEMYGPVRARSNIQMFRGVGGPAFAGALERFAYGGLYSRKLLPAKEREIVSVALLSCIERPNPFSWHAKAALRLGATPQQLKHAVLGQTLVSGVLTAFRGIAMLNPVIDDWRAHPAADAVA